VSEEVDPERPSEREVTVDHLVYGFVPSVFRRRPQE
jgi:hypothetical protein